MKDDSQGLHECHQKIQTVLLLPHFVQTLNIWDYKHSLDSAGAGGWWCWTFCYFFLSLTREDLHLCCQTRSCVLPTECTQEQSNPTKHWNSETLQRDWILQTHQSEQTFYSSLSIDLSSDCSPSTMDFSICVLVKGMLMCLQNPPYLQRLQKWLFSLTLESTQWYSWTYLFLAPISPTVLLQGTLPNLSPSSGGKDLRMPL